MEYRTTVIDSALVIISAQCSPMVDVEDVDGMDERDALAGEPLECCRERKSRILTEAWSIQSFTVKTTNFSLVSAKDQPDWMPKVWLRHRLQLHFRIFWLSRLPKRRNALQTGNIYIFRGFLLIYIFRLQWYFISR